jgi:hypothetical protein
VRSRGGVMPAIEDLVYHPWLRDAGHDPHGLAAAGTLEQVDLDDAAQPRGPPGPGLTARTSTGVAYRHWDSSITVDTRHTNGLVMPA